MTSGVADVVVVRAGPVGLTLSILLAQRGHAVSILERQPQPYPLPRAVHFDHEAGRTLLGVPIVEQGFSYDWLVADVILHDSGTFEPLNVQICDPARPTTVVTDLVFDVPHLIAQLSAVLPLLPGDVIFTGTPAGVGIVRKPPQFLQPGDTLETWIEGIGTIRNRIVEGD